MATIFWPKAPPPEDKRTYLLALGVKPVLVIPLLDAAALWKKNEEMVGESF